MVFSVTRSGSLHLDDDRHLVVWMTLVIYFLRRRRMAMGASQQKKTESRRAIIVAAARLFRERGIDDVTVADIMAAAGLTHGGFPRHFASKQELVTAAMAEVLGLNGSAPVLAATDLHSFAATYLRPEHRNAPGQGCLFAALGPEMARAPAPTRRMLTEAINAQIDQFAQSVADEDAHRRRVVAIGSWAAMVGAMVLARVSDLDDLSDEILAAAREFLDGA
ncbi:TetR/AcrR family transcriptional regulator [Xanthobacter autotrophicus]|uniref:TetR/AcrR family transcriptional regulator n=1 Tax=Xanthobacter autotrophicus TaxID=280 RepID=UPI00372BA271